MAKKPAPAKALVWAKAVWLAAVEAPDEAAAIEKGAAKLKMPGTRLAVRR